VSCSPRLQPVSRSPNRRPRSHCPTVSIRFCVILFRSASHGSGRGARVCLCTGAFSDCASRYLHWHRDGRSDCSGSLRLRGFEACQLRPDQATLVQCKGLGRSMQHCLGLRAAILQLWPCRWKLQTWPSCSRPPQRGTQETDLQWCEQVVGGLGGGRIVTPENVKLAEVIRSCCYCEPLVCVSLRRAGSVTVYVSGGAAGGECGWSGPLRRHGRTPGCKARICGLWSMMKVT